MISTDADLVGELARREGEGGAGECAIDASREGGDGATRNWKVREAI